MAILRIIVKLLGGWRATLFAVLAVAALVCFLVLRGNAAADRLRADAAEQRAEALAGQLQGARDIITTERKRADDMARLADQYEQDKRNAKADQERLAADLRAGNVRLRSLWQGCEATARVSTPSGATGEPDAVADDRAASAARIIGAARDADDQIKRLQEVIQQDRRAVK